VGRHELAITRHRGFFDFAVDEPVDHLCVDQVFIRDTSELGGIVLSIVVTIA
jgi:hypothetical protein